MSRYKGRTKPTLIERDFPHHIEIDGWQFRYLLRSSVIDT
jgi:hypothetical protein